MWVLFLNLYNVDIQYLFQEILEAIGLPYLIKIDIYALTSSNTRSEPMILHPSIPTAFNKVQKIVNFEAMKKLRTECKDPNLFQSILEHHQLVRLFGTNGSDSTEITSGLSIIKVISVWCYIQKL